MDLHETLKVLKEQGSDTQQIEVKSAQGGYPENTAQTMSAFSNTPGGGMILFGIAEQQGFDVVGVYDAAECQQAASNTARTALTPQRTVSSEVVVVDGKNVVVVHVPEADRGLKPIKLVKSGQAYIRMYDGDYRLSEAEEQILIAQRGHPHYDEQVVDGASRDDLDPVATAAYIDKRRSSSRRLSGMTDAEVLVRTGVLSSSGEHPTLAGLLALGIYPQQYFPSLAIQASLHSQEGTERALDAQYITGSIPAMMEDCMDWVRRVTPTAVVSDNSTGAVVDLPTYPPIVVRELVANALIHRDLSPASANQPVTLRLTQGEQMLIANPGGLFGLSVEGLGKAPSSLRNARLTDILQFTELRGQRVVERLGSGIPAAQKALRDAEMAPLRFDDRGVRFTVFVEASGARRGGRAGVSLAANTLLQAIGRKPATIAQLVELTKQSPSQVRYMVGKLLDSGDLVREPLDGRTNTYRLARDQV